MPTPCGICNKPAFSSSGLCDDCIRAEAFRPSTPEPDFNTEMSRLRDFFAGMAMQAMIAKSNGQDKTGGKKGIPLIAKYAYEFADAMIEERNQP